MALEVELKFYQEHRRELLERCRNFFVLIKGEKVVGVFPDAESAYRDGIAKFGLEPFLVKQVLDPEPVHISTVASLLSRSGRL